MNNTKAAIKKQNGLMLFIKQNLGILIFLVVICAVVSVIQPRFLGTKNLLNILRSISITGIIAFGMLLCIIIQGIDLSQGSVIGFTSCFCAFMISMVGMPFWAGVLSALAAGTLFGIFNGALLSHTKLPPFIVTLATQFIGRGGCYVITRGNMINVDSRFGELGNGYLFGVIPLPVVYLLFFFIIMFLLLEKSKFGRNVYAIGGNMEAARFTGINIKKVIWVIYGISGFLAAVCGIISCSRITTGQPTTGNAMEFDAVIACYLGGVSYLGGEGRISSTLLGAIVLGVLANAMSMLQIPWYVQNITKGTIILIAVFFDIWRKERENNKK
ncbi:ABC transporter permease [Kineothrix sedimenti]|uniref:ABC transporter permease n=1 Tax=Kineothrix sedimenti TaxID=3123317 RepID=A0ABZ3EXS1_9FIRM